MNTQTMKAKTVFVNELKTREIELYRILYLITCNLIVTHNFDFHNVISMFCNFIFLLQADCNFS